MIQEMCRTAHPFTWADALDRATYSKADRTIVHEASAWRMRRGFVVPIYGVGGEAHAITMAGDSPFADTAACATLYLLSLYAHGRANRLKRGGKEKAIGLRPRECEVLLWVAAGKSDWEIGEILRIGASTVHKHVESAKRKFGVRTRVQAVVAALRQGHIRP